MAGTGAYVAGTYVWTDYVYDDRGPDTQGDGTPTVTNPALGGGDATYPASAAPGNAADLVQLQIGLRRTGPQSQRGVTVKAVLETLIKPELPLLAVAFDTDNSSATGAPALPGAWVAGGPFGLEIALVISSSGGQVWRWSGSAWSTVAMVPSIIDPQTNVMSATLPLSIADPRNRKWRAFAALGLAGPSGTVAGSWLDGQSPVYDLAFIGNEPEYGWQDRRQADVLSGALLSSNAAAAVDFAKVAAGATEITDPVTPGFHTFLYHSRLELGEGVVTRPNGTHEFNGPYQPYLLFVPTVITEGRPLLIFMHGANQNHVGSVYAFPDGTYLGTGRALSEELYNIAAFVGDGVNFPPSVLQIYPLGRGETLGYVGSSEQDVLDATDDAVRRLGVDPDPVTLSGASMGGFGTFRLGALHPDRWAAAIPVIGYAASGGDASVSGGSFGLLANFAALPVRQVNGLLDFLVNHEGAEATAARVHELELEHRFWLLDERQHEAGGFVYQCVYDQAQGYVRNQNPARVVYRVDPSMISVDESTGLELRYDSAYWLSGIRVRDGAPWGQVDVTSHALPRWERILTEVDGNFSNLNGGRSLCGPDPAVPPTKDTWLELSWIASQGSPLPRANVLDVTLQSLASVGFDLARAGFEPGQSGKVKISSDTDVTIELDGLRQNQRVELDETKKVAADPSGVASIVVPAGAHQLVLSSCTRKSLVTRGGGAHAPLRPLAPGSCG